MVDNIFISLIIRIIIRIRPCKDTHQHERTATHKIEDPKTRAEKLYRSPVSH